MIRTYSAALVLVYLHAVRHCRASEQDPVIDIQYCLKHKLNTVTCKLDYPHNVVSPFMAGLEGFAPKYECLAVDLVIALYEGFPQPEACP
jgi:hypothetical protein